MSNGQDKDTDRSEVNKSLKPEQKERLRAAIQILIDYLLEDGYLTQHHHVPQKMGKGDLTETNTPSRLSETDIL